MALKKINYTGSSKVIIRLCEMVNQLIDRDGSVAVSDLTDVELTNLANDDILKYNSTTEKWENVEDAGGVTEFAELDDVNLTNLENGQVPKWNSDTEKWENADESGGSSVTVTQKLSSGVNIADITVDGTTTQLFAPQGGGGGGGSGYDATLLWDYKTDNNNSVLYGLNSATLHDSAENYDALIIEVVSVVSDETDATWKGTCQFFVDVNALGNAFNEKYIICESVANRSCKYHIDGTTLQKTAEATANTNGLVRVYGLKYGSGGSGGASALEDLTDVDLSSLSNGQILKWNATAQKWVNANESGGGSTLPFDVVIDSNDNGINLVYDDGQ